jgi:hypothetical protein
MHPLLLGGRIGMSAVLVSHKLSYYIRHTTTKCNTVKSNTVRLIDANTTPSPVKTSNDVGDGNVFEANNQFVLFKLRLKDEFLVWEIDPVPLHSKVA